MELTEQSTSQEEALLDNHNSYSAQSAGEPADRVPGAAWGGCLCALVFALWVPCHEHTETVEDVAALRPVHSSRH